MTNPRVPIRTEGNITMKGATRRRFLNGALGLSAAPALGFAQKGTHAAGERHRVMVSTDIGGSDLDDFQSMVHFLVYCDLFGRGGPGVVSLERRPRRSHPRSDRPVRSRLPKSSNMVGELSRT